MKCFNHHDRDAFGIDMITGKALCLECLETYKGRIIEKNNEESKTKVDLTDISFEHLKQTTKIMEHNKKVMDYNKNMWKFSYISTLILSIIASLVFIISLTTQDTKISFISCFIAIICILITKKTKKYIETTK